MPKLTPEQQIQQAGALLERLEGFIDQDYPSDKEKLQALEGSVEELKGLDIKGALDEVERKQAAMEKRMNAIRNSRKGLYIPGLEDEGKKFSMLRALSAGRRSRHKSDWEAQGAGFEFEVLKEVQEKHAGNYEHMKASQQVGDDELGGLYVPDQVIPDVIIPIYTRSAWFAMDPESGDTRVNLIDGVTGNVKLLKDRGGCTAYWAGEEEEVAESTIKAGAVTARPNKLICLVKITEEMDRFGAYGFEQRLRRNMSRAASKKFDYAIPYAPGGNNMPRGLVAHVAQNQAEDNIKLFNAATGATVGNPGDVADWGSAALDWTKFSEMVLALEEDDIETDEMFAAISAPRFFTKLKNTRIANYTGQTDGSYVFAPMMSDARLAEQLGHGFGKSTQIPTTNVPGASVPGAATTDANAKHTDVFAGDLSEISVVRWAGIEVIDDGGTGAGFVKGVRYQKLQLWADIIVTQPRAIILCPNAKVRA